MLGEDFKLLTPTVQFYIPILCSLLTQHATLTCFAIEDMMNCVNWRNSPIGCVYKVLFRKFQFIQECSCHLSNVYGKYKFFHFCAILSMLNNISVCDFLVVVVGVCLKLGPLEADHAVQPEHMVMCRCHRIWSLCWKWSLWVALPL